VVSIDSVEKRRRLLTTLLCWKIVEDRSRVDGASKADVRQLFDEWCQSTEPAAEQPESAHPIAQGSNARYGFCVLIDQASLESFNSSRKPWVNLIMRKLPYGPEQDDDHVDEDEEDDGLEEIEGSTEEDVGWCKVKTSTLLPDSFSNLCYPNAWYPFYQRPPAVV